jgi:HEPN domain-containing protein
MALTRRELQRLARTRLRDADVLLRARRFGGAYYLCGYVVECALKACIAKHTRRFEFPDRQMVERSWTHDPSALLRAAGLEATMKAARRIDATLDENWNIAKDWRETSRYEQRSEYEARQIYEAVSNPEHGVFQWLQQHW